MHERGSVTKTSILALALDSNQKAVLLDITVNPYDNRPDQKLAIFERKLDSIRKSDLSQVSQAVLVKREESSSDEFVLALRLKSSIAAY